MMSITKGYCRFKLVFKFTLRGELMFISLVIPTYNESKNVPILVERLSETLSNVQKK